MQTVLKSTTSKGRTCGIGTWLAWDAKYGELAWHTVCGHGTDWLLWSGQGIPSWLIGHIQSGHANALVARIAAKAMVSSALIPSFIRSLGRPVEDLVATFFLMTFKPNIPVWLRMFPRRCPTPKES
jgi:hypothetical protein